MWPVAIFLMLVVGFYWFAFCLTVAAWLKALIHLLGGNFIRAAIWLSIGCGMLFWWQGTEVIPHPWDVEAWLRGSAVIVGMGVLATFVRHRRKQQAMPTWPTIPTIPPMPTWPAPKTPANDNQLISISVIRK